MVSEEDVRSVLKVCGGTSFEELRDRALNRLLYDTGMRRGEAAGLRVEDLDWDSHWPWCSARGAVLERPPSAIKVARGDERTKKTAQRRMVSLPRERLRLSGGGRLELCSVTWLGDSRTNGVHPQREVLARPWVDRRHLPEVAQRP